MTSSPEIATEIASLRLFFGQLIVPDQLAEPLTGSM